MTIRSLCIHAHFYQPPREDPLTGIIPNESGAHPYLNWNELIHAECYRPNAELGNFEQISFNLGPTLGAWMQGYDPLVNGQIITQDQRNNRSDLAEVISKAIAFKGFSVVDIWGICPGRFSKRNRLTTKGIEEMLSRLAPFEGPVSENQRREFGEHYRELSAAQKPVPPPQAIGATYAPTSADRQEVIMLGSAGQRIITAGEILCLAGLHAGLNVTQKNDYDITVLRGPSISEMILSPQAIHYTGIQRPSVVSALGPEGVARRKKIFADLDDHSTVIQAVGVDVPASRAVSTG